MKQVVFHNGRVTLASIVRQQDIPIGAFFGILASPWHTAIAHFDIPAAGVRAGEEYSYTVVLTTYRRTIQGYQDIRGAEHTHFVYPAVVPVAQSRWGQ